MKKLFFIFVSSAFGFAQVFVVAPLPVRAEGSPITFLHYSQMGFPEQDIFMEKGNILESDTVYRQDLASGEFSAGDRIFAVRDSLSHDPFKTSSNALGPFPKGKDLGLTLGDWMRAEGSGTAANNANITHFVLSFKNLIPNGVYTVRCTRWTKNEASESPCASVSPDSFTADGSGNAEPRISVTPAIKSTADAFSGIEIVYESDGIPKKTREDFGRTSHVQLISLIPPGIALAGTAKGQTTGNAGAQGLGRGARGQEVKILQQALIAQGMLVRGNDTGFYGPRTQEAVRKFQQKHGIRQTGFFGPLTYAKLKEVLEGKK